MELEIICKNSAFKHGVSDADIRRAFQDIEYDSFFQGGDDSKNLLIGFDRNANLLEIMYNVIDENTVQVFHAMKCRPALLSLLKH
ncbi:MAG: hypothetical protein LBC67_06700 [Spirochaetales bacterium]|nr:hypothetical protein [Spirochaetales bacterium]